MTDIFRNDQALWYANGVWGELGFAVPNVGDDGTSNNETILTLVEMMGRNLQAIMCHTDADLRTPPSINTLTRIHKLVVRARSILAGRAVPPGTPNMESLHVNPGPQEFVLFPTPYFKVRNPWLKPYCGLILASLSEACQHTENRKPLEISLAFSGLVGQYLQRVYRRMASELFQLDSVAAQAADFTLTDAQLASYDPAKWFTSTEMIDRVAPLGMIPTEDDLSILSDGIPVSRLVNLSKWPGGEPVAMGTTPNSNATPGGATTGAGTAAGSSTSTSGNTSFAPAPGP